MAQTRVRFDCLFTIAPIVVLVGGLSIASLSEVRAEYIADTGRTQQVTLHGTPQWERVATTQPLTAAKVVPSSAGLVELCPPTLAESLRSAGVEWLAVQSEGWNYSARTWAEIQVAAITGKARFEKCDPLALALSIAYRHREWMDVPLLPIENPELAKLLGFSDGRRHRVSPAWVMRTPEAQQLVIGYLSRGDAAIAELEPAMQKAVKKFAYRVASFLNLPTEFRIVPVGPNESLWVSPFVLERPDLAESPDVASRLAQQSDELPYMVAARDLHTALRATTVEGNGGEELRQQVEKFRASVRDLPSYMPRDLLALDYFNTRFHPFQKAAWAYAIAFVFFLVYFWRASRSGAASPEPPASNEGMPREAASVEPTQLHVRALTPASEALLTETTQSVRTEAKQSAAGRWAYTVAFVAKLTAALLLILGLVIRYRLGGRMPVSNLYESITFTMGAFALLGLVFEWVTRRGWVGAGVALAGWACMLMANSLPLHMRKVEPLVAVLNSVWLNYHVTSLLISYGAFLLAFVFALLYLVQDARRQPIRALPPKETLDVMIYRCVQVGWPLLTLGIFLGAVWADTAWGRAWSWDPKETWALITWFAYTIYLHLRMILGWTGRRAVVASMVGFAMVLITYFGVSFLPGLAGGLHTYAEPISR
ncbi:MAG: c-type cytochrome biogenesis protein CcsB [Candidatus Sumerlaea chitinivorans]|nr:c-type cytochrome biogenesis protein CcsB [Candidatus Sumerlaea chitinivorans]